MPLEAGQPAPDLSLSSSSGASVRLKDLRGKWVVLYFYPNDDTPGCTTEACEFTGLNAQIKALGAQVLGVSPNSLESHAKFIAKFDLAVELLSDEDHAVCERYGVWVEKNNYGKITMGVQRATFLIGPDGKLAQVWPKVKAEGHAAEVLAALKGM